MPKNTTETDQELVAAAIADRQAFSHIVHRYEAPLGRYVRRVGATESDADDVLQEVFVKLFINLNDYDPHLKFSSWLYRIAHNETVSFLRKKNIRPGVLTLSAEDVDFFFEQLADETDFAELASRRYDAQIVRESLRELAPRYAEVLTLRFLEEKSYSEISDILKVPEGTVATLINRGKQALKGTLATRGITHI